MFRHKKDKLKPETKLLTEFIKSPQEFQTREKFKQVFSAYDKSNSGSSLYEPDVLELISDILKVTGRSEKLKKKVTKQPKIKVNWDKYYHDLKIAIFHSMDPSCINSLTLEQFCSRFENGAPHSDYSSSYSFSSQNSSLNSSSASRTPSSSMPSSVTSSDSSLTSFSSSSWFKLTNVDRIIEMKEEERVFIRQLRATKIGKKEKNDIDNMKEEDSHSQSQDWEESDESEKERKHEAAIQKLSCVKADEADKLRQKKVDEVSSILNIDKISAQALLDFERWDQNSLLTKFFEDKENLLKLSGIQLPENYDLDNQNGKEYIDESQAEVTCSICFDDYKQNEGTQLECKHWFCNDCWKGQIEIDISEANIITIGCMNKECLSLVPPDIVKKIISPELYKKYSSFMSKNFVDHNKDIKWCSTPKCESIITDYSVEGLLRIGECIECHNTFCWDCGQAAHSPATCEAIREWYKLGEKEGDTLGWLLKNNVDSNTLKWIQDNTKDCPQCGTSCQKNGGCFSMSCPGCRTQWCWGCSEKWLPLHSDHFKCPKFGGRVTDKPKNKDMTKYKQRRRLERLVKYYKEVNAIVELRKKHETAEIKESDQKKIAEIKKEFESFDVQFIIDARNLIIKSYATLQYATIMEFFLKGVDSDIVEFQKSNLKPKIDQLNSLLEKPPNQIHSGEIRLAITSTSEIRDKIVNHDIYTKRVKYTLEQ